MKNIIGIAIITIIISLFASNTFAQLTGSVGGGLPGASGGNNGNNNGGNNGTTAARRGRINPGGGTSKATNVIDLAAISNGVFYGTLFAYTTHFEVYTADGGIIKTYLNSCQQASPNNGVAGVVCSFGHFNSNGQLLYSGWTYIYDNGYVYLRWMYSYKSNFQTVDSDTGWIGFKPQ